MHTAAYSKEVAVFSIIPDAPNDPENFQASKELAQYSLDVSEILWRKIMAHVGEDERAMIRTYIQLREAVHCSNYDFFAAPVTSHKELHDVTEAAIQLLTDERADARDDYFH